MLSLSHYSRKNKGEVTTKSSVVKEIEVTTEHLGRDKSNSFKRVMRSRQLNNVMRCLMSQPEDNLSSHSLLMSRQTIICRDIKEKFASWAVFNFSLNLMTAHNSSMNLSRDKRK